LSHKYNAPILLTEPNTLNADTFAELQRLKATKVIIVGGTAAVSANVENQLKTMKISTTRIAGQDRYDTSVQVAKIIGSGKGVFITTGSNFPDALSAAPLAAAQGMPILLVPPDNIPASTQSYLNSSKIPKVYVLNGNNELTQNLISQLPNADVITGSDRYERNINLLKQFPDNLNFSSIYVATGTDYPDALAASALAQISQSPVILIPANTIPNSTAKLLSSKLIDQINIIGGDAAVSPAMASVLQALPAQIVSVNSITDSVADKQQYKFPQTVLATLSDGSQVSLPVTWSLTSVNTGQNNIYTNVNTNTVYTYAGLINNYSGNVTLTLTVNPALATVRFNPIMAEVVQGDTYTFPSTVVGLLSDSTIKQYPVTWNVTGSNTSMKNIGSYNFQGTVAGLSQKVNLTLKVVQNTVVTIPDANLFAAIQYQLTGSNTGNALYLSDVLKITTLNANGKYISDLTGIDQLQNLTSLDLGNNSLTQASLTPLQKLPNLNVLMLNNNQISNFAPLSSLSKLYSLYIHGNPSTNYTPLNGIYKNLAYKDF
jgi:putative cell wall-binding protein